MNNPFNYDTTKGGDMKVYGDSYTDYRWCAKVAPDNYVPMGHVYLHGNAEQINGYDLCYIDSKDAPTEKGIYPIELALTDGNTYEATMFWWFTTKVNEPFIRGLICLNDDDEGLSYAKECYDNDTEFL